MKKAGMVLEGGGTRGVFTAGVLDYFMEQGMYLPYVIGVSGRRLQRSRLCVTPAGPDEAVHD